MFRLLNTLYRDVWLSYTLYDIIKTEIVNVDNIPENSVTYNNEDKHNIFSYVNTRGVQEELDVVDGKDEYVFIDVGCDADVDVDVDVDMDMDVDMDAEKFQLKNQAFQLNFLRSDMISWKKSKLNYTYAEEADWEYINDPTNLPCNNYLLYLLENMPENIVCNTKNNDTNSNNKNTNLNDNIQKDGWKRADEIGFEKEACAILNTLELGEATRDNIWIDDRLLGEKWWGLFSSISPYDTYIEMDAPVLQ